MLRAMGAPSAQARPADVMPTRYGERFIGMNLQSSAGPRCASDPCILAWQPGCRWWHASCNDRQGCRERFQGVVMSNKDCCRPAAPVHRWLGGSVATDHDPAIVERDFDDVAAADLLGRPVDEGWRGVPFGPDATVPARCSAACSAGPPRATGRHPPNLLATLGPAVLAQILSLRGLGGVLGGAQPWQITPGRAARFLRRRSSKRPRRPNGRPLGSSTA